MGEKIAIITARGGSKRIHRKNVKLFCGKPIIQYSIDAALNSGIFDNVIVSTDDTKIAELSRQMGANVPFMRSAATSNDYATTVDVLVEVLHEYTKHVAEIDTFCCIYPTAPFVTGEKLKRAMTLLDTYVLDSVVPVVQYSFPPQRSFVVKNGKLIIKHPEYCMCRSQDLEPIYHDCGQFYCARKTSFDKYRMIFMPNTMPILTPEMEVQDIDTEDDWKIAEIKFQKMLETDGK